MRQQGFVHFLGVFVSFLLGLCSRLSHIQHKAVTVKTCLDVGGKETGRDDGGSSGQEQIFPFT